MNLSGRGVQDLAIYRRSDGGNSQNTNLTQMITLPLTRMAIRLALASVLSNWLHAEVAGDFTYTLNEGAVTISGFPVSYGGSVVIPSVIEGSPVIRIGDSAFMDCADITDVTIPSSVTSIGKSAFRRCSMLSSVVMSAGLNRIESMAFHWSGVKSVNLPNTLTYLGASAFEDCESLESVTIPLSLTDIQNATFFNCIKLNGISLPASTKSIGASAFRQCYSLSGIRIPKGVALIGMAAFGDCISLRDIVIEKGVSTIGDEAFGECAAIETISIPESVRSIKPGAFRNCTRLSRAVFAGDAPSGFLMFENCSADFRVYYRDGKAGFSWPKWGSYPTQPIGAEIAIQQPTGTYLVDGKSNRSFGTRRLGSKANRRKFRITNIGTESLTGIAITKKGTHPRDFTVSSPKKSTLQPGETAVFDVRFSPKKTGSRTAKINIRSSDLNESTFSVLVSGSGIK